MQNIVQSFRKGYLKIWGFLVKFQKLQPRGFFFSSNHLYITTARHFQLHSLFPEFLEYYLSRSCCLSEEIRPQNTEKLEEKKSILVSAFNKPHNTITMLFRC